MEVTTQKTWKPIVAGILNIIDGVVGVVGPILIIVWNVFSGESDLPISLTFPFIPGILLAILIVLILIAVLALVGGIFAVQRKRWGWSLAGSIAAILCFFPLGIVSTVLVGLSQGEFE